VSKEIIVSDHAHELIVRALGERAIRNNPIGVDELLLEWAVADQGRSSEDVVRLTHPSAWDAQELANTKAVEAEFTEPPKPTYQTYDLPQSVYLTYEPPKSAYQTRDLPTWDIGQVEYCVPAAPTNLPGQNDIADDAPWHSDDFPPDHTEPANQHEDPDQFTSPADVSVGVTPAVEQAKKPRRTKVQMDAVRTLVRDAYIEALGNGRWADGWLAAHEAALLVADEEAKKHRLTAVQGRQALTATMISEERTKFDNDAHVMREQHPTTLAEKYDDLGGSDGMASHVEEREPTGDPTEFQGVSEVVEPVVVAGTDDDIFAQFLNG
jgi:hypothetical protein